MRLRVCTSGAPFSGACRDHLSTMSWRLTIPHDRERGLTSNPAEQLASFLHIKVLTTAVDLCRHLSPPLFECRFLAWFRRSLRLWLDLQLLPDDTGELVARNIDRLSG